jgi:rSAM/selenodomain-associated transferase 1
LFNQQGDDLGDRMANALCAASLPAVLIGTDCPPIDTAYLHHAVEQLKRYPLIIAPAEDGGYGLIGMQSPTKALFQDIRWSTDQVFGQTLVRAEENDLDPYLLPEIWDVDEAADLDRWLAGDPKD